MTSTVTAQPGDVSGSVTITGTGSAGGAGEADASTTSTVSLDPPTGFSGSGATFGIIANYDVELGSNPGTIEATGNLELTVPLFDQDISTPIFVTGGSFTGLLQTASMTFVSCPCCGVHVNRWCDRVRK